MRFSHRLSIALFVLMGFGDVPAWAFEVGSAPSTAGAPVPVGVAVVDITPGYPIRLTGYGSRTTESEGVASPLKARALAIGGDGAEGGPAILVAVDNCAVGAKIVEEVAARLKSKVALKRERFTVCSTHTHCAPGTQ